MVEAKNKLSSHSWWLGNHSTTKLTRSSWLQSTLQELDVKTNAMLKVIEEDADSFAQRAEMYYKKRPELISMVEEFYRTHRSLAEKYDQARSDFSARVSAPWSLSKDKPDIKLMGLTEKSYDSYSESYEHSEICEHEESGESDVEDPEEEINTPFAKEILGEEEVSSGIRDDELMKLKKVIEALEEEKRIQKEELLEKDEEKREAIRQLSLAVDMLKEENSVLKRKIAKGTPNKQSPFELKILKGGFWGKLFDE